MRLGRTLHPNDQISHFRVVGPLGAGGMGEVYLARDQTLDRNVALKILPPELVRNEDRLRRFVLEAKSASSLSHPNIVTIYEIGEDRARAADSAGGESESSPVHFISMELVNGKTLSTHIHDEKSDVPTLLGYLVQAAEGLSKAHAAGIVHRDLKPGNIMVSNDGFTKVLDFGLAKLTEKRQAELDLSSASTVIDDGTSEGVVIGTAGYMAPEQVQGKTVDHRSDIFSLGCILYEATTRRRPFGAESSVETMHKILHEKPAPVEELNPSAPAELRRLIRRAMAKAPEHRLQSMKDLAIELREIVDEYDSLSASTSSGSSTASAALPAPARRRMGALVGGMGLVGVVGIVLGVIGILRGAREGPGEAFQSMRITTLTDRGDARDAVISPDGRYVSFTSGAPGQRSVWVRQVATGSDIQVLPPQPEGPFGLSFSPDGSYLFYLAPDLEQPGYRSLFQIPTVGGPARKRAYDVDSQISFGPDGKHVCFVRGVIEKRHDLIVILNLESSEERVLATIPQPRSISAGPLWSPRGDRIAVGEFDPTTRVRTRLVFYRVQDGRRDTLKSNTPWSRVPSIAWQPSGRGLLVAGVDLSVAPVPQISYVTYPDGRSRRVTNDMDGYSSVSISSNGEIIAADRFATIASLWTAAAGGHHDLRQIVMGSSRESGIWGFDPSEDGSIVFGSPIEHYLQLSTIAADGSGRRPITSGRTHVFNFRCIPGAVVYVLWDERGGRHLWRTDASGGEPRRLTSGSGESLEEVTRDGRLALFSPTDAPQELWVVPTTGGEARRIVTDSPGGWSQLSPDGGRVLYQSLQDVPGGLALKIAVVSGGEPTQLRLPPRAVDVQWAPDGQALTFRDEADGGWNIFRQPLGGGSPVQITHLAEGRITGYAWSPDGSRLLLRRRIGPVANLWVANADGSGAEPIARFETGMVFLMKWARDGRRVIFSYGTQSQDVVLIRKAK